MYGRSLGSIPSRTTPNASDVELSSKGSPSAQLAILGGTALPRLLQADTGTERPDR